MPGPLFAPTLPGQGFPVQDSFSIGGFTCPGKATIMPNKGASPRGWDERMGYGTTGATLVPTGDKLAEVDILVEIWDPNDMAVWREFATKFFTKSLFTAPGGVAGLALAVEHPVLKVPPLNLSSFVLLDITPWGNDGFGIWSCTISLKQFRRAQPQTLQRPLASIPDVDTPNADANSDLQAKIAARSAELAALAGP